MGVNLQYKGARLVYHLQYTFIELSLHSGRRPIRKRENPIVLQLQWAPLWPLQKCHFLLRFIAAAPWARWGRCMTVLLEKLAEINFVSHLCVWGRFQPVDKAHLFRKEWCTKLGGRTSSHMNCMPSLPLAAVIIPIWPRLVSCLCASSLAGSTYSILFKVNDVYVFVYTRPKLCLECWKICREVDNTSQLDHFWILVISLPHSHPCAYLLNCQVWQRRIWDDCCGGPSSH